MGKEGGGFSSFMRKTQGILETIPASVAVVAGTGQKGLSSLLSSTPLVIPLSIHPLTHSSILPLLTPPHRTTMHASPRPSSHIASSPTPLCTCLGFECGYIAIWHAAAVAASEAMAGHPLLVAHTLEIPFDQAPEGAEYLRMLKVVLMALNPEVARIARAHLNDRHIRGVTTAGN
jgi:hypothetical protein